MLITRTSVRRPGKYRSDGARRRYRGALIVAATLFLTVVAAGTAGADPVTVLAVDSLEQVLTNLRNWLVGILAAVATVCLTVGGARYLLSSGDPSEVEKAKIALKSACLGYALAILAPVIVAVLKSIVGG